MPKGKGKEKSFLELLFGPSPEKGAGKRAADVAGASLPKVDRAGNPIRKKRKKR